jgi:uncharacterized membrane protein
MPTDDSGKVAPSAPALWVKIATELLAIAGLGISTYLTIAHFIGTQSLACSDSGIVNCAKVTTSPQSEVFGIPVAMLGLGYYIVAVAMYSPWIWNSARKALHLAQIIFAVLGIVFVLWLITAELIIIKSICLWCTGVHVVTFALFVIVMATAPAVLAQASE